jgi:hypothetical protein
MAKQEVCQAQQDREAVEGAMGQMAHYIGSTTGEAWADSCMRASDYIDSLYKKFTPEISMQARFVGKIVASAGFAFLELRYGKDEYSAKLYSGTYEENVLATYHPARHSFQFLYNEFLYADAVNKREPGTYGDAEFARFPIIASFHDPIMGNERPNDERQSARLAGEFMCRIGMTLTPDEAVEAGILATTWDSNRKMQAVGPPTMPYAKYRRAAGVADLLTVFRDTGVYDGITLFPENFCKQENNQLFAREAAAVGFELEGASIDDCMKLVDSRSVLQQKYQGFLHGQAGFFKNFTPADPKLDEMFPGREQNIDRVKRLAIAYDRGDVSAHDTLVIARGFKQAA